MRIILVRHGRSAHIHTRGWIDRAGVEEWRTAYDAAGIRADDAPPHAMTALAAGSGVVVSSDMPRAIESAARLAPDRDVWRSELLRETPLPVPMTPGVRLPLALWGVLISVSWFRDLARAEPRERAPLIRGRAAADWLAVLAGEHDSVLAVTHGAIRRYIADALEASGWTRSPERRGYAHWSAWPFVRPGSRP